MNKAIMAAAVLGVGVGASGQTPERFTSDWETLKTYECPDWFRDAKFGIWAHWGPQAVPMAGDWYAKHTYIQGHRQYQHHLQTYGHPSKTGFKDIIPLWTAENFDPDRLMALYQRAGAKYFVSMGVHHDNFDLWNSKHHRWNAVNMGPQRDIVGQWKQAAKKYGLRFGVSEHLGASFTWWQVSHGSDKDGPLAGVPYDGADPQFQDLYHWPAQPGDSKWYSTDSRWHNQWRQRIGDLVDNYQPDLLYSDGGLPFGEVGRGLVAHFYNSSIQRTGRLEAVYTCKKMDSGEFVDGSCVQDMERGVLPGINPRPWQTDTSIADWFYNVNWKYRKADWVLRTLVDIVSKNGNLLLNVVQRPDGSIDPEVETLLNDLAEWTTINGEAIYGTRPWLSFGEGPQRPAGGHFKEDFDYSAADIRFTTKGPGSLYALLMDWPEQGRITIRSLAAIPQSGGKVTGVTLLGHDGPLQWSLDGEGLKVQLPPKRPCNHVYALKIQTPDASAFRPDLAAPEPAKDQPK